MQDRTMARLWKSFVTAGGIFCRGIACKKKSKWDTQLKGMVNVKKQKFVGWNKSIKEKWVGSVYQGIKYFDYDQYVHFRI